VEKELFLVAEQKVDTRSQFNLSPMLPKKQRIPKALARDIFMRGSTTPSPHFILRTAKSPGDTRFAVSISKKVAPTAVARNRSRRRIYSALRVFVPLAQKGFLAAITVKKGGEDLPYVDISKEIEALLKRARVM